MTPNEYGQRHSLFLAHLPARMYVATSFSLEQETQLTRQQRLRTPPESFLVFI